MLNEKIKTETDGIISQLVNLLDKFEKELNSISDDVTPEMRKNREEDARNRYRTPVNQLIGIINENLAKLEQERKRWLDPLTSTMEALKHIGARRYEQMLQAMLPDFSEPQLITLISQTDTPALLLSIWFTVQKKGMDSPEILQKLNDKMSKFVPTGRIEKIQQTEIKANKILQRFHETPLMGTDT